MEIVIDNFKAGVAQSPHDGFADMRNVILDGASGGVEIGWQAQRVASTAITDEVIAFTRGTNSSVGSQGTAQGFFAISRDGQILFSPTGVSWDIIQHVPEANTDAADIKYWTNFVLFTGNASLYAFGPLNTGSAVTSTLGTFKSSDSLTVDKFHPIIVGQNNVVYVGDERYIASVQETSGSTFFGGTANTYIFNNNALDLPDGFRVKTFTELGEKLLIGTWMGQESNDFKVGNIYPWDRTSDSFDLPIKLSKNGVHALITEDNVATFIGGVEGEVFATNNVAVRRVTQIPKHITRVEGDKWLDFYPYNLMSHRGKLYFAPVSPDASNSNEAVFDGVGVWSYDLTTGALIMENQIDTGRTGAVSPNPQNNEVSITGLYPVDQNSYLIGFKQNNDGGSTIYGIDKVSNTVRYVNYAARIDSQYYSVGTKTQPMTFSELKFELSKPLLTDQGIRFSYRTNLQDSFTSIRTFDFATDGAIQTGITDFRLETDAGIQIRTEMTTATSSTTTVELKRIIIR